MAEAETELLEGAAKPKRSSKLKGLLISGKEKAKAASTGALSKGKAAKASAAALGKPLVAKATAKTKPLVAKATVMTKPLLAKASAKTKPIVAGVKKKLGLLRAERALLPKQDDCQINVTVLQAKDLLKMDTFSHSDPYVVLEIAGKRYMSECIDDTANPVFNWPLQVAGDSDILLTAVRRDGIRIEVWDKDLLYDDLIGVATVSEMQRFEDRPHCLLWLTLHRVDAETGEVSTAGMIEVSVQVLSRVSMVTVREWTHLIEMDVLSVHSLDKSALPWLFAASGGVADNNPRVKMEWSTQVLVSGSAPHAATDESRSLVWNDKCFLFLDTARHWKFQLTFKLQPGEGRALHSKDTLPFGHVPARLFYDAIKRAQKKKKRPSDDSPPASEDSAPASASAPSAADETAAFYEVEIPLRKHYVAKDSELAALTLDFGEELPDDFLKEDESVDLIERMASASGSALTDRIRGLSAPQQKAALAVSGHADISAALTTDKVLGVLRVRFCVAERKQVTDAIFDSLLRHADFDGDGRLHFSELQELFYGMALDTPVADIESWLDKYDLNRDGFLDKSEIMAMLKDYHFTSTRLFSNLAFEMVRKRRGDCEEAKSDLCTPSTLAADVTLMHSVTRGDFTTTGRKVIEIKDRRTGLIIVENVPDYVWLALKLMYSSGAGRMLTAQIGKVLKQMSVRKGSRYDAAESVSEIMPFMKLYGLRWREIVLPLSAFGCFNDFFARAIKVEECRPLPTVEQTAGAPQLLSAADCRLMAFDSFVSSILWIKGDAFTLDNLLQQRFAAIGKKVAGGPLLIFRLAPQDYHRWHWPVSGTVTAITPLDGALFTVNPLAVNSQLNVYTENKRCIVEVDTGQHMFGTVVLIAVAATVVGSYRLFRGDAPDRLQVGHCVKQGDVAGEFRFGGSTILLLLEPGRVTLDTDLRVNTDMNLETLIRCRESIGQKTVAASSD